MPVFERPLGAPGDTAELNYVCALHQTVERRTASIDAVDIRCFLRSRYGIEVETSVIADTILQSLAWTNTNTNTPHNNGVDGVAPEDEAEQMDQMELLTVLLIPYLCKARRVAVGRKLPKHVSEPAASVLPLVCQIIRDDVRFLQTAGGDGDDGETRPLAPLSPSSTSTSPQQQRAAAAAPRLTATWLQSVLRAYGEEDLASDGVLIAAMMRMTAGRQHHDGDDDDGYFTPAVFAQALTGDVIHVYDPADETRYATAMQDALYAQTLREQFQTMEAVRGRQQEHEGDADIVEQPSRGEDTTTPPYTRVPTAPAIDLTADTYRSKSLIVVLMVGVMFSYMAYIGSTGIRAGSSMMCPDLVKGASWRDNALELFCGTGNSVLWWSLTFVGLSIFGNILVGFGSLGNSPGVSPRWPLTGAAFCFVAILFPAILAATESEESVQAGPRSLRILAALPLIYVLIMHLLHFTTSGMEGRCEARLMREPLQDEQNLKAATQFKINRLVDNALEIHRSTDGASEQIVKSRFGHALHAFSKYHETERVGGFFWVWEQIWNGSLTRQEGVWFSARFLAANVAQYVVATGVLIGGVILTQRSRDGIDLDNVAQWLYTVLDSILVQQEDGKALLFGDADLTCSQISFYDSDEILNEICPDWPECETDKNVELLCALLDMRMLAEALLPSEEYMLTVPVALGAICAFLTAFLLAISYLPSVAATTLKLRSGVIPTLNSSKMAVYRKAQVMITLLMGCIFWSCVVASALVGTIVFTFLFFFLYDRTSYYAQRIFIIGVGVLLSVLLRTIIMMLGGQKYFQAFYRTKPRDANVYILALEWANFALTVAFALGRFAKLMAVAALSVGRIDTQILSDDVIYLGPIDMDNAPTMHTRDILMHEAHRHPYMEALGSFYLTKLRYGNRYCTRAGSAWRLIFVYALMPWMQKHRISNEIEETEEYKTDGPSSMSFFSKAHSCQLATQTNDELYDENERLRKELTRLRVLMAAKQGNSSAGTDSLSMYLNDAQERLSLDRGGSRSTGESDKNRPKRNRKKKKDAPPDQTVGLPAMPAIVETGDNSR